MISRIKNRSIRWLVRINILLIGVAIVMKADTQERTGVITKMQEDCGFLCYPDRDKFIRRDQEPERFAAIVRNNNMLGTLLIVLVLMEPGLRVLYDRIKTKN